MATSAKRGRGGAADGIPESAPVSSPVIFPGQHGHDFTLQAVLDLQRSVGGLQATLEALKDSIEATKTSAADTKNKVQNLEKMAYAAVVVMALVGAAIGWMASVVKDVGLTYMKATIEHKGEVRPAEDPPPSVTSAPAKRR